MTLEQASFLAQIISAIAVIASLVFVGVQLHQATAAIRGSSSQAHSGLYTELVRSIIDNGDFARVWSIGLMNPESLAEDEWTRFVAYASALFRLYESSRVQWLNGRLDEEHWHTIERQAVDFGHLPGLRLAWDLRAHWFSPEFRNWFENLAPSELPRPYRRPPRKRKQAG
ncbi:MAG TPA: hypothetical protein VFO51_07240 [Sphingomicrobium sp.]|nr:hypothetical protein [Sphingomicrobium sp.]